MMDLFKYFFADLKISITFVSAIAEIHGSLAQLVQSVCLTSRGSGVRLPQLPPKKMTFSSHLFFCYIRSHPLVHIRSYQLLELLAWNFPFDAEKYAFSLFENCHHETAYRILVSHRIESDEFAVFLGLHQELKGAV